jgi:hypothetical protein
MNRQTFGIRIEQNVVKSLRNAKVKLRTSPNLDHNHKIDFILLINGMEFGVQFSLKIDMIKALAAKACALDVVPRFIYLRIDADFFKKPNHANGKDLYQFLDSVTANYQEAALLIDINRSGLLVQPL